MVPLVADWKNVVASRTSTGLESSGSTNVFFAVATPSECEAVSVCDSAFSCTKKLCSFAKVCRLLELGSYIMSLTDFVATKI